MNKHLGHLLVFTAFVGLGNGLGGGPGGGGAAGSVGGPLNAITAGSPSDPSRSGLDGSGNHLAAKNSTLGSGSSSGGGGGGVGASSSGSGGLGGPTLSGGSSTTGAVGAAGSSRGAPESSGSTRSTPSANAGRGLHLTEGFGAGDSGADVPGGAASDLGGFGGGSIFGDSLSGFGSSSGGAAAGPGGSAGGTVGFSGNQVPGRDLDFENDFAPSWGPNVSPGSSFLTRGSSTGASGFGEARPGGHGAWGSGPNLYGGEGAPGGGTHGFDGFNGGPEFDNFGSGASAFGLPEGTRGVLGADGTGSGGEAGPFSAPFAQPEPGDIFGSEAGHGGSFPSSSGQALRKNGYIGSPTGESSPDFGRSYPDGSNGPSGSLAQVPGGSERRRLFSSLLSGARRGPGLFGLGHGGRKTDPRVAAAVALGTLAGVAALGSLTAGIAAAVQARRRNGVMGLRGHRRGCVSGGCRRKKRSIPESKVPTETLNHISMDFERLY